jgi:hypothetical protein
MSRASSLASILAVFSAGIAGQTAVWTGHYDNFRTGANTHETVLNPYNVNAAHFGRLASVPVSGCVFAQPLYVPNVPTTGGGHRNLLIVATTANMVYAYDADDYSLYFSNSYGVPFPSTVVDPDVGYYDFFDCDVDPEISNPGPMGIVGTPVVDVAENALYFVAAITTGSSDMPEYRHILHKISLTTGADLTPPVSIDGSYVGVPFQTRYELQRCALLLLNGRIYIAFGSHHDETPYYGWLFAYDKNLTQVGVMNYSPLKWGSGIWQSGGGPATDGQYIYLNTGNNIQGDADASDNSESILKIDPVTLQVAARTSFFPEGNDWDYNEDLDLGSSRVVPIPGTHYGFSGSKLGDLFVIDRDTMNVAQRQKGASRQSMGNDWTGIYNGLAYWNHTIYVWPGGGGLAYGPGPPFPTDTLKAFALSADSSSAQLVADGEADGLGAGYQGANVVVSANGDDPSTGIVWAYAPELSTIGLQPGYLHAYYASNFFNGVFHELWNNRTPDSPDLGCSFAKFTQPTVANGKVFLPTFCGRVIVYGLLDIPGLKRPSPRRPILPVRR